MLLLVNTYVVLVLLLINDISKATEMLIIIIPTLRSGSLMG